MKVFIYLSLFLSSVYAQFEYGKSYNCFVKDTNQMTFSFTFHSSGNMVTFVPRNQKIYYNELYWSKNRYVNTMETKIELFIKDAQQQLTVLSYNGEKGTLHRCK